MPADATLLRAANGARILEALDNYARAEVTAGDANAGAPRDHDFVGDELFWYHAFDGQVRPGATVQFKVSGVLSEWVPRVPGLFWSRCSSLLRKEARQYVESPTALKPFGKSSLVSGGVGTLKLAPSESGYRLCSLGTSGSASAGVPLLIAPDVWEYHRLREGNVLRIDRATWQEMAKTWADQFPSTRNIPRAYFRLDRPEQLKVEERNGAIEIDPFSIMRYYKGNAELYDFVVACVVSTDPRCRLEIEQFFDSYKDVDDRAGRYLLSADQTQPIWEAIYSSPAELAQAIGLVQRRIEDAMVGANTTDYLLDVLTRLNVGLLRRASNDIGIPDSTWFRDGSLAEESRNLVERVPRAKVAQLIDAIRVINPYVLEAA